MGLVRCCTSRFQYLVMWRLHCVKQLPLHVLINLIPWPSGQSALRHNSPRLRPKPIRAFIVQEETWGLFSVPRFKALGIQEVPVLTFVPERPGDCGAWTRGIFIQDVLACMSKGVFILRLTTVVVKSPVLNLRRQRKSVNWLKYSVISECFSSTVERGDPGVLSQHEDAVSWLQVGPAHRPRYPSRAVQPSTKPSFLWPGIQRFIIFLLLH